MSSEPTAPPDPPPARPLRVSAAQGGQRLDLFLAEQLALSRAQARRLLARGAVAVDGRPAAEDAKGRALAPGSVVSVKPFRRPEAQRARPEPDAPLPVLASGEGWLAVDKTAGVPVHPLREDYERSRVASINASI